MGSEIDKVQIQGVMPTSNGCAVFLKGTQKTFVIYMDKTIGSTIEQAISGMQFERPQTHELMISLFNGLGVGIERVVINEVSQSTFFARLIVSMKNELGQKIVEIDARPSDSIILALLSEKPIYATQKVLDSVDDMALIFEKILKQNEGDASTGEA